MHAFSSVTDYISEDDADMHKGTLLSNGCTWDVHASVRHPLVIAR